MANFKKNVRTGFISDSARSKRTPRRTTHCQRTFMATSKQVVLMTGSHAPTIIGEDAKCRSLDCFYTSGKHKVRKWQRGGKPKLVMRAWVFSKWSFDILRQQCLCVLFLREKQSIESTSRRVTVWLFVIFFLKRGSSIVRGKKWCFDFCPKQGKQNNFTSSTAQGGGGSFKNRKL